METVQRLPIYLTFDDRGTRQTQNRRTHHHAALDAAHADDRVVGLRPARGRVNHNPDRLPQHERQRVGLKHHQDVLFAEDLLQAVEGQAGIPPQNLPVFSICYRHVLQS